MKAIVQHCYGGPEQLRLEDLRTPEPAADQVLIRVHAASVNAYDWHVMRGDPRLARVAMSRPRGQARGRDVAGIVEAVGTEIGDLAVGDRVYGDLGESEGAFAEYAVARRGCVDRMPAGLTFEQAAALPLAATTALMGLRDAAETAPGQRVLVNGASGGVGTFAVQIAKALGAHVTGVCSARNAELVTALGADEVIDYTRTDATRTGASYDVVLDLVGNHSLRSLRRVLAPGGVVVLSGGGVFQGGSLAGPMALIVKAKLVAPFIHDRVVVLETAPSASHLAALRDLVESGYLSPAIDRTFPLVDTPAAISYLEQEHARAKVIISVLG
ncbi:MULTISPECIES: NAD(P)-dependent alcohol dehydrogenase [Nocardioides]|uniref:NAD(P)-dependent alcohol dehydrogenase n=1 Tax=Nocardioides vastitatis TaxID=2568655 RepID=A0ABW0ZMZ0_9ACTN|nr:NAD(P)-dependent alcohol dehydrogenase [Nocardioides sp.]THI96643.1 NAD(P)-dependent alcohol dehydrogenase [Nocardioides sp.]